MSYQSAGWADKATYSQDVEIIRELLEHQDIEVRRLAIGSIGALAAVRTKEAIDLALEVQVDGNQSLAIELCKLFGPWWHVPLGELTADDLERLLSRLADVENIEQWDINTFLVKASMVNARAVVSLLLTRIKRAAIMETSYHALPVLRFQQTLEGLVSNPCQINILRDIRDAILEPGWQFKWEVPKLFREVSSGFELVGSIQVLEEWINSGDSNKIEHAARLVSGANPDFIFNKLEFISNLVARANDAGDECYLNVCGTLSGIGFSGTYSRTPGQPSPRHLVLKDRSLMVADQFASGTPTHRFYELLAEEAESFIEGELLRDEEEENY